MSRDVDGMERRWRLLLPEPVRSLPRDLALVTALVLLTDLSVLLPVVRDTPLRVALGLPFLLFAPGYALVSALFPEDDELDGLERVALSLGLSVALVPLIGLALNFTPLGIRLVPVLLSVSGATLLLIAAASERRRRIPKDRRFAVPLDAWIGAVRRELLEPETRTDRVLNALLVLSVLLALASLTYAVTVPKEGERFTEFYLLMEDDGELVASGYPSSLSGDPVTLHVGVGNQEHRTRNYTVVVLLQRVEVRNATGNVTATVREERELRRYAVRLDHNETDLRSVEVAAPPGFPRGPDRRLLVLLYRGAAPPDPGLDTAYRETHLWLDVE